MKKLRKHGYKNWLAAMDRGCAPGHAPHNPWVVYSQSEGFRFCSALTPIRDDEVVALPNYEPYGTSVSEYREAIKYVEEM